MVRVGCMYVCMYVCNTYLSDATALIESVQHVHIAVREEGIADVVRSETDRDAGGSKLMHWSHASPSRSDVGDTILHSHVYIHIFT